MNSGGRKMAGLMTCVALALMSFGTESSDVREYCLTEHFNASCDADDVILMTSASYGRMRLGRCIRGDFNLGCSNDVVTHFDALCTGRKSCDVSVRSLVDMRPCQRDFASYLEAAFKCIAVLDLRLAYCPLEGRVVITTPSGYLSNSLYGSYSALGRQSCPWVIHSLRGQRVQLSLISLHSSVTQSGNCPKVIIHDSDTGQAQEFNVCGKRERERHMYTSLGHHVTVYTVDVATNEERKFLLYFRVVGCPLLNVSGGGIWVKPLGVLGDDLMIRCNETQETWYVTCKDNQWQGDYGNCTSQADSTHSSNGIQRRGTGSSSVQFLTQGLLLALGLGLILGIVIAFVALLGICCFKHWCRQHEPTKELTSLTGGLGDEVCVVERRFPSLLTDIETVAHLGLENVYVGPGGPGRIIGCRGHCGSGGHSSRKVLNSNTPPICDLHLTRMRSCNGGAGEVRKGVDGGVAGFEPNEFNVTKSDSDKIISAQLFCDEGLLVNGERYPPGLRTPEHRPSVV